MKGNYNSEQFGCFRICRIESFSGSKFEIIQNSASLCIFSLTCPSQHYYAYNEALIIGIKNDFSPLYIVYTPSTFVYIARALDQGSARIEIRSVPDTHRYPKFFSDRYPVPIGTQFFSSSRYPVPIGTQIF